MKKYLGFTIVELMISLLIASVLLGAGIPALGDFLATRALGADLSRFTTSLTVARSEAITRGSNVVVCPTDDGLTCKASKAWGAGWLVFRDINSNQMPDLGGGDCAAGEDCIIRYDQGMKAPSVANSNQNFLAFNARGERVTGSATSIKVCNAKVKNVSNLTVVASGSVSIVTAAGVCP